MLLTLHKHHPATCLASHTQAENQLNSTQLAGRIFNTRGTSILVHNFFAEFCVHPTAIRRDAMMPATILSRDARCVTHERATARYRQRSVSIDVYQYKDEAA